MSYNWRQSSNINKINFNSFNIKQFKNFYIYKVNEFFLEDNLKGYKLNNFFISLEEILNDINIIEEIKDIEIKNEIYCNFIYSLINKNFKNDDDFLCFNNNFVNIFDSFFYNKLKMIPIFNINVLYINFSIKLIFNFKFYMENAQKNDIINYKINSIITPNYNSNKIFFVLLKYIEYNKYNNKNELNKIFNKFFSKHSYLKNDIPIDKTLFVLIKNINSNKTKIVIKRYYIELIWNNSVNKEFNKNAHYLSYKYNNVLNKSSDFKIFGFMVNDISENLEFNIFSNKSNLINNSKNYPEKSNWAVFAQNKDINITKAFLEQLENNNFFSILNLQAPNCFLIKENNLDNPIIDWLESLNNKLDNKFKYVFLILNKNNFQIYLKEIFIKFNSINFIIINYLYEESYNYHNCQNKMISNLIFNYTKNYFYNMLKNNYNIFIILKGNKNYYILNIELYNKNTFHNYFLLKFQNLKNLLNKNKEKNNIIITDFSIDFDLEIDYIYFNIYKNELNKFINLKENFVLTTHKLVDFKTFTYNLNHGNYKLFYENFYSYYLKDNLNNNKNTNYLNNQLKSDFIFSINDQILILKFINQNKILTQKNIIKNGDMLNELLKFIFLDNNFSFNELYEFKKNCAFFDFGDELEFVNRNVNIYF